MYPRGLISASVVLERPEQPPTTADAVGQGFAPAAGPASMSSVTSPTHGDWAKLGYGADGGLDSCEARVGSFGRRLPPISPSIADLPHRDWEPPASVQKTDFPAALRVQESARGSAGAVRSSNAAKEHSTGHSDSTAHRGGEREVSYDVFQDIARPSPARGHGRTILQRLTRKPTGCGRSSSSSDSSAPLLPAAGMESQARSQASDSNVRRGSAAAAAAAATGKDKEVGQQKTKPEATDVFAAVSGGVQLYQGRGTALLSRPAMSQPGPHGPRDVAAKDPPWLIDRMFPLRHKGIASAELLSCDHRPTSGTQGGLSGYGALAASPVSAAARFARDARAAKGPNVTDDSRKRLQGLLALPPGLLRGNDADDLLRRVYEYFREHGFAVAMTSRVLNSVLLAFIVLFSAMLMAGVDWTALVACGASPTPGSAQAAGAPAATSRLQRNCSDASRFISAEFLANPQGSGEWLVLAYVIALGLYWGWAMLVLPSSAMRFWSMGTFYGDWLGIPENTLPAAPWESIVLRLEELAARGELPIDLGLAVNPSRSADIPPSLVSTAAALDDGATAWKHALGDTGRGGDRWAVSGANSGLRKAAAIGERADAFRETGTKAVDATAGQHRCPRLLSTHSIAARITRMDNYLVALAADGELDVDASVSFPATPTACTRWLWHRRTARLCWRTTVRVCARLCDSVPEEVDVAQPSQAQLQREGVPLWEGDRPLAGGPALAQREKVSSAGAAAVTMAVKSGAGGTPAAGRVGHGSVTTGDAAETSESENETGQDQGQDTQGKEEQEEASAPAEAGASSRPCCQLRRGWVTVRLWLPMTRTMEAHTRQVLLRPLFGQDMRLRRSFVRDAQGLRRAFRLQGLVHLFVMPFALVFALVFWVLSLFEEARSSQNYLGARVWSPQAQWLFREYNELPHSLARRCAAAVPKAEAYLKQFPVPLLEVVGRFVAFVSGSLLAALLGMALLVDDQMLTDMQLGSKNLLWYVAVLSAAMAAGRSMIPAPEDTAVSPRRAMQSLAAMTHHMPATWHGNEHTNEVRNAVLALFPNRAVLALRELAAIVLAPIILCAVMPRRAAGLLRKLQDLTVEADGIGDVCVHSVSGLALPLSEPPEGADSPSSASSSSSSGRRASAARDVDDVKVSVERANCVAQPAVANGGERDAMKMRMRRQQRRAPRSALPDPALEASSLAPSARKAERSAAAFLCQNPFASRSYARHDVPGVASGFGAAQQRNGSTSALRELARTVASVSVDGLLPADVREAMGGGVSASLRLVRELQWENAGRDPDIASSGGMTTAGEVEAMAFERMHSAAATKQALERSRLAQPRQGSRSQVRDPPTGFRGGRSASLPGASFSPAHLRDWTVVEPGPAAAPVALAGDGLCPPLDAGTGGKSASSQGQWIAPQLPPGAPDDGPGAARGITGRALDGAAAVTQALVAAAHGARHFDPGAEEDAALLRATVLRAKDTAHPDAQTGGLGRDLPAAHDTQGVGAMLRAIGRPDLPM